MCVGGVTLIFSNIVNFWVIEKLLAAEGMVRDNQMLALQRIVQQIPKYPDLIRLIYKIQA